MGDTPRPQANAQGGSPKKLREAGRLQYDWTVGFKLKDPSTPGRTPLRLGPPQRTPRMKPAALPRTPWNSARQTEAGHTPARAPGDSAQQAHAAFRKPELVATSLTKLPNILSAEYWLRKADLEEKRGDTKAAVDTLQEAMRRDVRPAASIVTAFNALKSRLERASVAPPLKGEAQKPEGPDVVMPTEPGQYGDGKSSATPSTLADLKDGTRRNSQVRFCTPEANVLIPAASPAPAFGVNSSRAGSTPFHTGQSKARGTRGAGAAIGSGCLKVVDEMDMSSLQKALEDVSPNTQTDVLCRDILEATITEMAVPDGVPTTPQGTKGVVREHGNIEESCRGPAQESVAGTAAAQVQGDETSPGVHVQINPMFNLTPSPGSASATPTETCYTPASQPQPISRMPTPMGIPALFATFAGRTHLFSPGVPAPPPRSRLAMCSGPAANLDHVLALQGKEPERSSPQKTIPVMSTEGAETRTLTPLLSAADALGPLGSPLEHATESPQKHLTPIAAPPFSLTAAFGSPQGSVMSPQTPAAPQSPPAHPPPVPYIPPVGPLDSPSCLSTATNLNLTPSTASYTQSTSAGMSLSARSAGSSLQEVESGVTDTPTSAGDSDASEEWAGEGIIGDVASKSASPDGDKATASAPGERTTGAGGRAMKGRAADTAPTPSRALRVSTPASRSVHRVSAKEVKGILEGGQAPLDLGHMGSCVRLSPVRAPPKLRDALGSQMVVTPVRRSARKSHAPTPVASLLRQTHYSYTPNVALETQLPEGLPARLFDCPPPPPPTPAEGANPAPLGDITSKAYGVSDGTKAGSEDRELVNSLTEKLSAVTIADTELEFNMPQSAENSPGGVTPESGPLRPANREVNQPSTSGKGSAAKPTKRATRRVRKEDYPLDLSPTDARIRDGLRRSSRLRGSSVNL